MKFVLISPDGPVLTGRLKLSGWYVSMRDPLSPGEGIFREGDRLRDCCVDLIGFRQYRNPVRRTTLIWKAEE